MLIRLKVIIFVIVFCCLSACSPLIKIEQPTRIDNQTLPIDGSVGQTFVSRYAGLKGVEVYLSPTMNKNGNFVLYLKESQDSSKIIAKATLKSSEISQPSYYRFVFPLRNNSFLKYYYFEIRSEDNAEVSLGKAPGDTYLNGAMYLDRTPQNAQLNFNLIYDRKQALIGVFHELIQWFLYCLVGILLFILPGWALLHGLYSKWSMLSWEEKVGISAGSSLAIYPLLFLWTSVIHLHLGFLYAVIPAALGGVYLIWSDRSNWLGLKRSIFLRSNLRGTITQYYADHSERFLQGIVFVVILGMVFAVRFWVIRTLDAPMWGDSYQHTVISQLLVNNNGLFNSWQPYAALSTFTYHFGFHTAVAVFYWITHLDMPHAVLWVGQILNGLAIISLYPLAMRISNNRWSGVIAVLIAGLLSPMPMYYVNWGRYTQLAGQVILPALVFLAGELIIISEKKSETGKQIVLLAILLAGLALTHYRIIIFAIIFLFSLFIVDIRNSKLKTILLKIFIIGFASFTIFAPWFINILGGKFLPFFINRVSTPVSQVSEFTLQSNSIGNLYFYLPSYLWILIFICIGIGVWQKNKTLINVCLWWFIILLATNPNWLNLPGIGLISNFALFIATYIFAGIIIGGISGLFISNFQKPLNITAHILLSLIIIFSGIWGIRKRLNDIVPSKFSLVTRPDIRAFNWIRENTHPNDRFLVNSFLAFNNTVAVGSDGGWWLSYFCERESTLPPINYATERGFNPDFALSVKNISKTIQTIGDNESELINFLVQQGITHVYIGQLQGTVNNPGLSIDPYRLITNPYLQLIFNEDRVWLFKIVSK
jgi:hypothetical protein